MSGTNLRRGSVVLVRLDPIEGHEQAGVRPAVVVSDPSRASKARFPLIAVVPVTRTAVPGPWSIRVAAGTGGLRADSSVLVDQVRSIDVGRILRVYDVVPSEPLGRIDAGSRDFLAL